MEGVVLHRVGILGFSLSRTGSGSAAPLYQNMGQVPPPRPEAVQNTIFSLDFCLSISPWHASLSILEICWLISHSANTVN